MSLKRITYIGVYGVAINDHCILLTPKGDSSIYKGLWDLPGGGVEFGETPEETLSREYKEEVAMSFTSMIWIANQSYTGTWIRNDTPFAFHHLGQIYFVKDCVQIPGIIAQDPHEWHSIDKIKLDTLTPFAQIGLTETIKFFS